MANGTLRLALIGAVCAMSIVAPALAQSGGTYVITITNEITPAQPSTNVEIWATWDDPNGNFVFGGGNYDLTASDSKFTSATQVLSGPGTTAGIISGNKVTGAALGQVHLPPLGLFGAPDNPILLASYVWTTTNFTARTITFETSNTNNFIVSDLVTGATTQLYPHSFRPGIGVIIPPSPSTLAALALGGIVISRRRRMMR